MHATNDTDLHAIPSHLLPEALVSILGLLQHVKGSMQLRIILYSHHRVLPQGRPCGATVCQGLKQRSSCKTS